MPKAPKVQLPLYQDTIFSEDILEALQQDVRGFRIIAEILKDLTGINLEENEKNLFLMAGRLNKVLRKLGLSSYQEYIALLKSEKPEHINSLVTALTTNTTEFFREAEHFDLLKTVVQEILKRKGAMHELRIWCSASSTGQEAYSIAMALEEARILLPTFKLKILATDIDSEVLQKASKGIYTKKDVASVPALLRKKYFQLLPNGWSAKDGVEDKERKYQVSPLLQHSISFASFNLLSETYPFKFPFDIIFCRNVLIYFDRPTSAGIIAKFARALGKSSYLFLGHAETGTMRNEDLKLVGSALYQKKI